ncbi:MAG: hypothetical protein AAF378_14280 [Cyanobacteria bacterium P01_A01_bin.84]
MNSIKQKLGIIATGAILTLTTGSLPALALTSNFNSLNGIQENSSQNLVAEKGEFSVAKRPVRYKRKRVCVIKIRRYKGRLRRIKKCRYVRVRKGGGFKSKR